jgi:hypothetical protein
VGLLDRIEAFFGEGFPVALIEPYRRAGGEAYSLLDETPAESWARLAAWNAFFMQVYADHLRTACTSGRYIEPDVAPFICTLYEQANVWIEVARKALASDSYRFVFSLPSPLPHWQLPYRSDGELTGMRAMLDDARIRVASELAEFAGGDARRGLLGVRLAEVDAKAMSVGLMWTPRAPDGLRGRMGDKLADALDDAFELGQLLAQPELMKGLA